MRLDSCVNSWRRPPHDSLRSAEIGCPNFFVAHSRFCAQMASVNGGPVDERTKRVGCMLIRADRSWERRLDRTPSRQEMYVAARAGASHANPEAWPSFYLHSKGQMRARGLISWPFIYDGLIKAHQAVCVSGFLFDAPFARVYEQPLWLFEWESDFGCEARLISCLTLESVSILNVLVHELARVVRYVCWARAQKHIYSSYRSKNSVQESDEKGMSQKLVELRMHHSPDLPEET